MAQEHRKSSSLTELTTDNAKSRINSPANLFALGQTVSVLSADSDTSVYYFIDVPTDAYHIAAVVANTAITGATDCDLGLFYPAVGTAAPVVVDKDCLLDGISVATARTPTDLTDLTDINKPYWQIAGLASDPGGTFWVGLTGNTIGNAAGTVYVQMQWRA